MNDRALKVLEQYELDVTGTRRGRGCWYLDTPEGTGILSEYAGTENRALFQNLVMGAVCEGGYRNVDVILPNKEGLLVSKDWEENRYVVKKWYPGRECDPSNEAEVLRAVENLARLHCLMRLKEENDCYAARPPLEELRAWNAQLRKIRTFVRTRQKKSAFEQLFLDSYDQYLQQATEALSQLSRVNDLLEELREDKKGCVCHGDYSHHHVLICGYEIATTNFDCCRFDFQVNDLYRFMRKILEKHDWNTRLGMRMLESYGRVRPLSHTERRLLYVRMLYPEKFRKLAGTYYGGSKAWISRQYSDKLVKMNRQEKARAGFLKLLEA
ncbi:MAG: phosphotransferase [Clostridiales bacterium]|nr:phosphotransferase [Clostridiales bacterium]MCC8105883.1 phosphotransferase [Clostridiales bacterium]